jgi:membrane protein required for colicin V production
MNFNQLDLVLFIILAVLIIRATIRGFITEFCAMAATILGILAAIFFSKPLGDLINSIFGPSMWSQVIAFLVLFLVVYLIIKLLEGVIENGIEKLNLEKLDRVMGFFLGIVEGMLAVCLLLIVIQFLIVQFPLFDFLNPFIKQSFVARLLLPLITPATKSILSKGMAFARLMESYV